MFLSNIHPKIGTPPPPMIGLENPEIRKNIKMQLLSKSALLRRFFILEMGLKGEDEEKGKTIA